MDVAKTLVLNFDKGDNTIIYFQVYIGEKRDVSPQSLIKCIELDIWAVASVPQKSLYTRWEPCISNKGTVQFCRENLPFM